MSRDISNNDDVIDSRDVIERIEAIEALQQAVEDAKQELDDCEDASSQVFADCAKALIAAEDEYGEDEAFELTTLKALAEECEGYVEDWEYGATLIRYSYFTEYCQEMLEDCGDLPKDLPSYIVIDWEATSHNLKVDYTEVDFDGVAYLVR